MGRWLINAENARNKETKMSTPAKDFHAKKQEFKQLFGVSAEQFMDMEMFALDRKFHVDVMKLDDWMVANKGYDSDSGQSLSEFVIQTYGAEAEKFIRENI